MARSARSPMLTLRPEVRSPDMDRAIHPMARRTRRHTGAALLSLAATLVTAPAQAEAGSAPCSGPPPNVTRVTTDGLTTTIPQPETGSGERAFQLDLSGH